MAAARPYPRFRRDLVVRRIVESGDASWTVHDPLRHAYYRHDALTHEMCELLDGTRGPDEMLDALHARFPQYAAGMEERHHSQKKDSPSGTALRIAAEVKDGSGSKLDPPIAASRVGSEFGLHTLFFDSPDDLVEISHRARGREGFARGAVLAAEMIRSRKGLFRFEELVMS